MDQDEDVDSLHIRMDARSHAHIASIDLNTYNFLFLDVDVI
jgi:hypothetical protein